MVFVEDGGFVTPGQPVCVTEEFLPGVNTRKIQENLVISLKTGFVTYDRNRRIVNIRPAKSLETLSLRDLVLAEVKEVQEKIAIAEIIAINNRGFRSLKHRRTAVILPSQKMRHEMSGYVGVGDLVLAEVVTLFSGVIGLSIWKKGLGALQSICSRCGRILRREDKSLVCVKCQNREKRKITPQYGNIAHLFSMLR